MTVRLTFCLTRLPHLSHEAFIEHWRDRHGPLVLARRQALRILHYQQSYPMVSAAGQALAATRGAPPPFDGVASLWFASEEELRASGRTQEGRRAAAELLEDERRFIDLARSPLWLATDLDIFERPEPPEKPD